MVEVNFSIHRNLHRIQMCVILQRKRNKLLASLADNANLKQLDRLSVERKIEMKKILSSLLALSAIVTLATCGATSKIPTASSVSEKDTANDSDKTTAEDAAPLDKSTVPASEEEAQRLAFGKVLWDVYQRRTLPDGSALDYMGMEAAAENRFALTDVDGDGQEELLLFWDNACMAGTTEFIFGYDSGGIHVELSAFPDLIFYDNGIVEESWSHNQGLAGRFWPYNIYRYDAENDAYQYFGGVDAWDKDVQEENYEGDSFPTDIDVDGDGLVYYILSADWGGQYNMPLVDGADYENWRNTFMDEAEEINILTQKLTEENIAALGYPKPDVPLPQPAG